MRASAARLLDSPVQLGTLRFPRSAVLVGRTRLVFIHLDNLLTFAKRDRDGRVDGYVVAYLPDETLLLFLRGGEAVNAAALSPTGRAPVPLAEAIRRMQAEPERGELEYASAPLEQLAWMYQACAHPAEPLVLDPGRPATIIAVLAQQEFSGVVELIADGRVSYLQLHEGRFQGGYFADRPAEVPIGRHIELVLQPSPLGARPAVAAFWFPPLETLPTQASPALLDTFRVLYRRFVAEVENELPGEGTSRAARALSAVAGAHPVLTLLAAPPPGTETTTVAEPEALTRALAAWTRALLDEVEVVSPGTGPLAVKQATHEQRHVLQSMGFYELVPWRPAW